MLLKLLYLDIDLDLEYHFDLMIEQHIQNTQQLIVQQTLHLTEGISVVLHQTQKPSQVLAQQR